MSMTKQEEEKLFLDVIEPLSEEAEFVGSIFDELKGIGRKNKILEFFSSDFCIFSVVEGEYNLFEVYNRDTKKSDFSYIKDKGLYKSYLLNLISRVESHGHKKSYL